MSEHDHHQIPQDLSETNAPTTALELTEEKEDGTRALRNMEKDMVDRQIEHQRSIPRQTNRYKCCLCLIVIVTILIIILPPIAKQFGWI